MKRKILSVLSVLMAVLMSTAAFSACSKAPAGADSGSGSGESVSESSESGAQTSTDEENSGDNGAQSDRRNLQLYFREIDHPQKYFRHIASVANPGTKAWFNLISSDYLLIDIDKDIFAVKYSE